MESNSDHNSKATKKSDKKMTLGGNLRYGNKGTLISIPLCTTLYQKFH